MFRIAKGVFMLGAPPTWAASFVPMAVGYVCAFTLGGASLSALNVLWLALSFVAMALIETGKHAVNDLVDYATGNDTAVDEEHLTPFSGGKKVLTGGIMSPKEVLAVAVLTMGAAGVAGLVLVFFQSFAVLWFGIAGVIISIIYTCPPFSLCYRGLGEAAVGITYGPLVLMGAYFLFENGNNCKIPLLMSVFFGILIANVLVINEYPDYEADVSAGKMNLIARTGKKAGLRWYLGLFLISYVPVLLLIICTGRFIWLVSLVLLPFMVAAYLNAIAHYDHIGKLLLSNKLTLLIYILAGALMSFCVLQI